MDYRQIYNSDYFTKTYSRIEELKKDYPVNHGFIHIDNVISNAKKCAEIFNLNEKQKSLLYIACVLHDIGYLNGRDDHAKTGAQDARVYLNQYSDMSKSDINKICAAISNHGGKTIDCYKDEISICLIIADKLDFIKSRYSNEQKFKDKVDMFKNINNSEIRLTEDTLKLVVEFEDKRYIKQFEKSDYKNKLEKCFLILAQVIYKNFEFDFVSKK